MTLNNTSNCGIKEFSGIRHHASPQSFLRQVYHDVFESGVNPGIVWFSDSNERSIGYQIHKYIENCKLGKVTCSNPTRNPNSGNTITMWIWEIDKENLRRWGITKGRGEKSHGRFAIYLWKLRKKITKKLPKIELPVPEAPQNQEPAKS